MESGGGFGGLVFLGFFYIKNIEGLEGKAFWRGTTVGL